MFLIDAIKPNVEKKFNACISTRLFRGGKLGEYKKKYVLFLFVLGLVAAKKHYSKETRICLQHLKSIMSIFLKF